MKVPICIPSFNEEEVQNVNRVVRSGWVARGPEIEEFEQKLAKYLDVQEVVTLNSGTAAIEVALRALDISNKEVITTATSCAPTANGIIHSGNKPIMIDISKDDYNIEVSLIEKQITSQTGAILPVHLYGRPANMGKIMEISQKYNLPVVEDCAQSLGSRYMGKMTGAIGEVGCFSLNINKIITTGEGGFIATNNPLIAERARIIRNYGREVSRSDYCYTLFGYNFKFTNLQAALGLAQLSKIESLIKARRQNAAYLRSLLLDVPGIQLPEAGNGEFSVYFSFPILLKKEGIRDQLKEFLEKRGIEVRTLFRPMCTQPYYVKLFGPNSQSYPNAEHIGKNGLYIGCYPQLTKEQMEYMAKCIKEGLQLA